MTVKAVSQDQCYGCHACFNICPVRAISMSEDDEGFKYPIIDEKKCINCGKCEAICPVLAQKKQFHSKAPEFYAVWNKEDAVRNRSSSGGVFRAIAMNILDAGGTVYGAAFDENNKLRHLRVENEAELGCLMGAKYLQSDIGTAYGQVRADLRSGRQVLFSGTPCQVAGLYAYLGGDDDKLLTADVICHGVPSPKVFAKYLEGQEAGEGCLIDFRNKKNGWKNYDIVIGDKREKFSDNSYMEGFLSNLYLRPSCAQCGFAGFPRPGDFTLGDFWGAGAFRRKYDDDRGTSLVLLNSDKAKHKFAMLKDWFALAERVPQFSAIEYNPSLIKCSKPSPKRDAFFAALNEGKNWHELADEFLKAKHCLCRKVGILNLQYSNNFGACLVAYALQTAIEKCGSKAEIIDFRPLGKSSVFSRRYWLERTIGKNFERFRQKFLKRSPVCYHAEDLCEMNRRYDTFAVGSDQVWRFLYVFKSIPEFFLEFAKSHKTLFSYAASFGVDFWEGDDKATETASRNLARFNAVSVRESSGEEICRKTFGVEAKQVLDPTLLLKAEEYEPIIRSEKLDIAPHYIAEMLLDSNEEADKKVKEMAASRGYRIENIYGNSRLVKGQSIMFFRSVPQWLGLIKNAEFVVTDSFHCVCFAIIFKKPFICVVNPERGISRLDSLLRLFGLRNRLVEYLRGDEVDNKEIDYDAVEKQLEVERGKSYAFLRDCLQQAGKAPAPRKEQYSLYLFGKVLLAKVIRRGELEIIKLFNILPIMKIIKMPTKRKYYLGGFLPLLTLKCKKR